MDHLFPRREGRHFHLPGRVAPGITPFFLATGLEHSNAHLADSHQSAEPIGLRVERRVSEDHQRAVSTTSSPTWLINASRATRTASAIASFEIDSARLMASQAIPCATTFNTSLIKSARTAKRGPNVTHCGIGNDKPSKNLLVEAPRRVWVRFHRDDLYPLHSGVVTEGSVWWADGDLPPHWSGE